MQLKGENLEVGDDFDFAEYLANAQAETAEDLIELTRGTWVMLGVFFVFVCAFMVTRAPLLQLIVFICFGYCTPPPPPAAVPGCSRRLTHAPRGVQ